MLTGFTNGPVDGALLEPIQRPQALMNSGQGFRTEVMLIDSTAIQIFEVIVQESEGPQGGLTGVGVGHLSGDMAVDSGTRIGVAGSQTDLH